MARSLQTHPAAALATFDDEQLTTLLAARPDLVDPPPADLASLGRRAFTWASVYACYRRLDLWCQQVVDALCLLPAPTTVVDLVALLGPDADEARVGDAIAVLAERALALRHDDAVELVSPLRGLQYPARLGPPATEALKVHTAGELATMARRLGADAATTKAGTLAAVASALSEPDRLRRVVEAGPEGSVALIFQIAAGGPCANVSGGLYTGVVSDRTPLGWLLNHGILAVASWNTVVMPAEVGLALRDGRPFPHLAQHRPSPESVEIGAEAVDSAAAQAGLRLVADVITVLDAWSATPPMLNKAGGLGVREVRRAAKSLDRSDVEAARLVDLVAAAGLIAIDWRSGAVLPTAAYDGWLELEPAARWATLAEAWLHSPLHLSLAGAIDTKNKAIPPLLDRVPEPDAARRRHAALGVLATMPPGTGVERDSLTACLQWEASLLWADGPTTPARLVDWVVTEAELVGVAARGALSTAGRLALDDRRDAAVAALRGHAPAVSSSFVVQADLTVVAPGELPATIRTELELLGEIESKGAATVYRLSEQSLRRGFDAGRSAEAIVGFLEAHATRGVPQSLTYLVNDLGRRYGTLRVGSARCYLRSDDPSLLNEVVRARRAAKLGLRLLAPTVAVADVEPAAAIAALREAGYLPAQEDASGGLVLEARQSRRAETTRRPAIAERTARAASARADGGPDGVDVAGLVARLRASPPPPTSSSAPPVPPGRAPIAPAFDLPDLEQWDDGVRNDLTPRPLAIAKGRREIEDLLLQAWEEDWLLRLAYTSGNGRETQLNVAILDDPADDILVECLPAAETRTLALDRIQWARVMTDAEEELLY